jgi:transcription antitermination factor NusG
MRQYGRVRRLVDRPLINCYIFVNITKDKYLTVMETENVVNFAKSGPKPDGCQRRRNKDHQASYDGR